MLLVLIGATLAWTTPPTSNPHPHPATRTALDVGAGVGIGIVAALMGVAPGELLILTIVRLFAVDIKTAGSLPGRIPRLGPSRSTATGVTTVSPCSPPTKPFSSP
jgi:hypothetical protein